MVTSCSAPKFSLARHSLRRRRMRKTRSIALCAARGPLENDLQDVSMGFKYVNMADITRDPSSDPRNGPLGATAEGAVRRRQAAGQPRLRTSSSFSSPIAISPAIRTPFWRNTGSGGPTTGCCILSAAIPASSCQPSRDPEDHQAIARTRAQTAHRRRLHRPARRSGRPPRASALPHHQGNATGRPADGAAGAAGGSGPCFRGARGGSGDQTVSARHDFEEDRAQVESLDPRLGSGRQESAERTGHDAIRSTRGAPARRCAARADRR